VLTIERLHAGYGRLEVLHGVDLAVKTDQIVVVLGANGAGKTTLCRAISGLIPARDGTIRFLGEDVTKHTPSQRVRLGIAHVPEGRQVFPEMSVRDNLRLGAYVHGEPSPSELAVAFEMFPILAERQKQDAGLLSGGQQQMLALARALMARPKLLVLDEPSQGLAPQTVEQVGRAVLQIAAGGGIDSFGRAESDVDGDGCSIRFRP
jgi:branched-chain amino acid transport system ATP-binding protein